MNKSIAFAALLAIAAISFVYFEKTSQTDAFELWKQDFGTPFEASEEAYRRLIF